jgi:hypothetical protein
LAISPSSGSPPSAPLGTPLDISAYVIPDGDAKLASGANWVLHKVLGIGNPWMELLSDGAQELAVQGRYELLDRAVKERWQLLNMNVAFPWLMYVDRQGVNFEATPPQFMASGDAMSVCVRSS